MMENLLPSEISLLHDTLTNNNDVSLETIFSNISVPINDLESYTTFKSGMTKFTMSKLLSEDNDYEYKRRIPSFIVVDSDKSRTIAIDDHMFMNFVFNDYEVINVFLKQLASIPEDVTVNLIISISLINVDIYAIDAATFIRNIINQVKAKKIMNFGSETNVLELLIGSCCDDIYISDFASVIINHSVNFNKIPEFLSPVFSQFMKFTYQFWEKKGLFTAEEVADLTNKNSSAYVSMFSDEIRKRMNI